MNKSNGGNDNVINEDLLKNLYQMAQINRIDIKKYIDQHTKVLDVSGLFAELKEYIPSELYVSIEKVLRIT